MENANLLWESGAETPKASYVWRSARPAMSAHHVAVDRRRARPRALVAAASAPPGGERGWRGGGGLQGEAHLAPAHLPLNTRRGPGG